MADQNPVTCPAASPAAPCASCGGPTMYRGPGDVYTYHIVGCRLYSPPLLANCTVVFDGPASFVVPSSVTIVAQITWDDVANAARAGWKAHDQQPGMELEEVVRKVVAAFKTLKGVPL